MRRFFKVFKNGKCGLLDNRGNILIPVIYDKIQAMLRLDHDESIYPLADTNYIIAEQNNKWGCIDWKNNTILPFLYGTNSLVSCCGNFFIVQANGKYGCMNSRNSQIIKPIYDSIAYLGEGMLRLFSQTQKNYTYFNLNDNIQFLSPLNILEYSEELGTAENKLHEFGFVDKQGQKRIDFNFDEGATFVNGLAIVLKKGKLGCIDKNGNIVIECIYNEIENCGKNFWVVWDGYKYGLIRRGGEIVIPCKCDWIFCRNNISLYLMIREDHRLRCIDTSGNEIIPEKCDFVFKAGRYISDCASDLERTGIAIVGKNGRYGYVNKQGSLITDILYSEATPFYENTRYALAWRGKSCFVIDDIGNEILEIHDYESDSGIELLDNGLVKVVFHSIQGRYGYGYIGLNGMRYFDN